MAPNSLPVIEKSANIGRARLTGKNTASDGSTPGGDTAISTLYTPGANGSYVYRVKVHNSQIALAASTAMVIRLFVTDTSGANPYLYDEYVLPAATRTAGVSGAALNVTFPGRGLFLGANQLLKVGQSAYAGVQDQNDVIAEGGDL